MAEALQPPQPGTHDRSVPTGTLEESAATLFEAMSAARDAEESGDQRPQHGFYRALAVATLLLPVPPGSQQAARRALESAVRDEDEVEIGVMLAREPGGGPVSVFFASPASLAAWAPTGGGSIALPARIVLQNLAAAGYPAILDPAGPIPYRFEPDELRQLAGGTVPGTREPLASPAGSTSVRVRLAGSDSATIEAAVARALPATSVDEAHIVETQGRKGVGLLIGLIAARPPGRREMRSLTAAARRAGRGRAVDVELLEEPMLSQVRALGLPFYRRSGRGAPR